MREAIVGAWRRLSGPQRAVVLALAAVALVLGVSEASSWAENSLGRPRYEVVWETALPESHRAYATATSDGEYVVVLHTSSLKRAYKLSPSGQISWGLEFAPTRFRPPAGIYNESLEISGVIPTADGGAMAHGVMNRVFDRTTVPKYENAPYVASIGGDGTLRWQKEIRPSGGRRNLSSFGFSPAAPIATGGVFFSQASSAPAPSAADRGDIIPGFGIAWWVQVDANGDVVAEHFDLDAARTGFETELRAPVWVDGILYALRGSRRAVDLTTRKVVPWGPDRGETIVQVNPESGVVQTRADLPYSCTTLAPTASGAALSCFDRNPDPRAANSLAVWINEEFKIVASAMVWERANPTRGMAAFRIVPQGMTEVHSTGGSGSAIGGRHVRVGLLNQSGEVVVQRRFNRLLWHSMVWDLTRGLDSDTCRFRKF